jgi:hypothetical protein
LLDSLFEYPAGGGYSLLVHDMQAFKFFSSETASCRLRRSGVKHPTGAKPY